MNYTEYTKKTATNRECMTGDMRIQQVIKPQDETKHINLILMDVYDCESTHTRKTTQNKMSIDK